MNVLFQVAVESRPRECYLRGLFQLSQLRVDFANFGGEPMEADEKFFGNMLRQLRVRFHEGANCIAMKGQGAKLLWLSDSHIMDCLGQASRAPRQVCQAKDSSN